MPSLHAHRSVALVAIACMLGCPQGPQDTTVVSATSDPDESSSSSTTGANTNTTDDTTGVTAGTTGLESESESGATTSSSTASATAETTAGQGVCGDGEVQGDEECDDGNDNDLDACLSSCERAGCGDGILHEDFGEECDDGNAVEDDGCNSQCGRDRYVFLSSEANQGSFGAVSGANSICKSLAEDAGLPNPLTYRAWMSDDTHNPDKWFVKGRGRYLLTNGVVVADDWDDLTDGSIQNPIVVDENQMNLGGSAVFTNTDVNGLPHPEFADCMGWTSKEFMVYGRLGTASKTDEEWTDVEDNPHSCAGIGRFYCFEN